MCTLLESGINIVTTRAEFHHRDSIEPSVRERIEAACERGGSSVHSAGSSPGFATELLPLAFASMQRRLDCLTKEESADMSSRNSPEMMHNLGFGRDPASLDQTVQNASVLSAARSMRMVAEALSIPIDDVVAGPVEYAVARRPVEIAVGTIEAGTVAARRTEVTGLRNGRPLYRRLTTYYVTRDIDRSGSFTTLGGTSSSRVTCPMDVTITFPVSEADYPSLSPRFTAHPPINAVPYVCEAPPGIQTTADLPLILANLGP